MEQRWLEISDSNMRRVLATFLSLLYRYTGRTQLSWEEVDERGRRNCSIEVFQGTTLQDLSARICPSSDTTRFEWILSSEIHSDLSGLHQKPATLSSDLRLRLVVEMRQGTFAYGLRYPSDEFSDERVSQLVHHFHMLHHVATLDARRSIVEIPLVQGDEWTKIIYRWNATETRISGLGILELFEIQTLRYPERIALRHGQREMTFRQLAERSNQLAHFLQSRGAAKGVFVGLLFENCLDSIVSIFAVLKSGAVYVPLDPTHPVARNTSIAEVAGLAFVVTNNQFGVELGGVPIVYLNEHSQQIEAEPIAGSFSGRDLDAPMYIVFTSGSTGEPNGVIGTQRSVINGLSATLFNPEKADEVCCLNAPTTVGFLVLGIYLPLVCGVPLVILSREDYTDPARLASAICRERITNIAIPSPALRQLLALGDLLGSDLASLRVIQVGGSTVTQDLIEGVQTLLPQTELRISYGSTEAGGMATRGGPRAHSVGRPVCNVRVYILDELRRPVPIGVTGEIYVGAAHLALGYLNNPSLTTDRFSDDPFCKERGRMFKTGDLGRYHENGEIEVLGRLDDQANVRGYRVSLVEIEAVLVQHEHIQEAAVRAWELAGDSRLVAYLVTGAPTDISALALRTYLRDRLPEYMIPSSFQGLQALPRTDSGKIDRHALPPPGRARPEIPTSFVAPRNVREDYIASVWAELLEIDRVGVHDDFLELGGDSLFAVRAAARIWAHFKVQIPLTSIFEFPTVALLAELLPEEPKQVET